MLACNINKKIIPGDYSIIKIVKRLYNTPGTLAMLVTSFNSLFAKFSERVVSVQLSFAGISDEVSVQIE